jgi:hypothetical protein
VAKATRRQKRDDGDRRARRRIPWHGRLDRLLLPILGPAQVGPYDTPRPAAADVTLCPACGSLMTGHEREYVGGKARVYCPVPRA